MDGKQNASKFDLKQPRRSSNAETLLASSGTSRGTAAAPTTSALATNKTAINKRVIVSVLSEDAGITGHYSSPTQPRASFLSKLTRTGPASNEQQQHNPASKGASSTPPASQKPSCRSPNAQSPASSPISPNDDACDTLTTASEMFNTIGNSNLRRITTECPSGVGHHLHASETEFAMKGPIEIREADEVCEQEDNLGIPLWPSRAETLELDLKPIPHTVYSLKNYSQVAVPESQPEPPQKVQEFQKSHSGHDWHQGSKHVHLFKSKHSAKRMSDTSMYKPRADLMKSSSKSKVVSKIEPDQIASSSAIGRVTASTSSNSFNANSRPSIASTNSISQQGNQTRHLGGSRMDRMRKLFASPLSLRSSSSTNQTPSNFCTNMMGSGEKQPRLSLQAGGGMMNKPNHLMHAVYHRTGAHFGRNSQMRSKSAKGFRVYGCPLATANNIYPITCFGRTDIYKNQQSVPYVLPRLCNYIEATSSSLTHEGIFRVSGNARLMEKLRTLFDHLGDAPLEIESVDVATSASMLKMYLRELPEPLIPSRMSIYFISLAKKYFHLLSKDPALNASGSQAKAFADLNSSSGTSKSSTDGTSQPGKPSSLEQHQKLTDENLKAAFARDLTKLVHKLPPDNYNLLKYLCCFLHRVTLKQKYNKMCAEALGIVFGPNIFRIRSESYKGLKEQELSNLIMACIISDYKRIFDCELTDPLGNLIDPHEEESPKQIPKPINLSKQVDTTHSGTQHPATNFDTSSEYNEANEENAHDPSKSGRLRRRRRSHRCCMHQDCMIEQDENNPNEDLSRRAANVAKSGCDGSDEETSDREYDDDDEESYTPTSDTGSYCSSIDSESMLSSTDPDTINQRIYYENDDDDDVDDDDDGDIDDGSSQMSSSECVSSSSYTPSSSRFDNAHNCEDNLSSGSTASSGADNHDEDHQSKQIEAMEAATSCGSQDPDSHEGMPAKYRQEPSPMVDANQACDSINPAVISEKSTLVSSQTGNHRASRKKRANIKVQTMCTSARNDFRVEFAVTSSGGQDRHKRTRNEEEVPSTMRVRHYLAPSTKKHHQRSGRQARFMGRRSSSVSSLCQGINLKEKLRNEAKGATNVTEALTRKSHRYKSARSSNEKRRAHMMRNSRSKTDHALGARLATSSDSSSQNRTPSRDKHNYENTYRSSGKRKHRRKSTDASRTHRNEEGHDEYWNDINDPIVYFDGLEFNIMQDGYFLMRAFNSDETLLRSTGYHNNFEHSIPVNQINHGRRFSGHDFTIPKTAHLADLLNNCSPFEEETHESGNGPSSNDDDIQLKAFDASRSSTGLPVDNPNSQETKISEATLAKRHSQPVERQFRISVISLLDNRPNSAGLTHLDSSINFHRNMSSHDIRNGDSVDCLEIQMKTTKDLIRSMKLLLKHVVAYGYNDGIMNLTDNMSVHHPNIDDIMTTLSIEDKLLCHSDYMSAKSLAKHIDLLDRELTSNSMLDDSSSEAFIICRDSNSIKKISQALRLKINQMRQNYVHMRDIRDHYMSNHCDKLERKDENTRYNCRSLDSLMDHFEPGLTKGSHTRKLKCSSREKNSSSTAHIKKASMTKRVEGLIDDEEDEIEDEEDGVVVCEDTTRATDLNSKSAAVADDDDEPKKTSSEIHEDKRKQSITSCHFGTLCPVEFVYNIEKLLAYKREVNNRDGCKLNEMTCEQLSSEKLELQKNLLRFEHWFGRPVSSRQDAGYWAYVGHLYERYRLVKMLKSRLQKQQDNCDSFG